MGFKMKGMSALSSSDTPILKKNLGKNIDSNKIIIFI